METVYDSYESAHLGIDGLSAGDLRARIVDAARKLFLDHGYSKVSTTEIAQAVGISKKTLYKEFENKEEILSEVIIPKIRASTRELNTLMKDRSVPVLERLQSVMEMIGFQYQKVSHVLMRDISIHAPNVWQEIHEFRKERFRKFGLLLQEAFDAGLVRDDIRPEVILRFYTSAVDSLMTPSALGELPCTAHQVFQSLVTILLHGILREDVKTRKKPLSGKTR